MKCVFCSRTLSRVVFLIKEDSRAMGNFPIVTCQMGHQWVFRVLAYHDGQYECTFSSNESSDAMETFYIPIERLLPSVGAGELQ